MGILDVRNEVSGMEWGEDYHRTFPFPIVLNQDASLQVQMPTQSCQVWQLTSPPAQNVCSSVVFEFCS